MRDAIWQIIRQPTGLGLEGVALLCLIALSPHAARAASSPDADGFVLERTVLLQRHGVRAPTQPPETLTRLANRPWPAWSVAPGDLTAHGAQGVRLMGAALSQSLGDVGLVPIHGCPAEGTVLIIADGQDQRTRASGAALADSLAPGCGLRVNSGPPSVVDPLFDSSSLCPINPDAAKAAIFEEAGDGGLETPKTVAALGVIQQVTAPRGCQGQGGVCLKGPSEITALASGVKLRGPIADGAVLSEVFLLEYAEGFPESEVAWGAVSKPGLFDQIMPVHERAASLTRKTPYLASRRGALMAKAMLAVLEGKGFAPKVTAFVGHDTNLSNMAGIFGLDWTLLGQPDPTGPSVTLALELWRNPTSGERRVRPFVYYQTLDDLRHLAPSAARRVAVRFAGCPDVKGCPLPVLAAKLDARLSTDCPSAIDNVEGTNRLSAGSL